MRRRSCCSQRSAAQHPPDCSQAPPRLPPPAPQVYLFMGVCVGSAVMPIAFCLTWAKCTGGAAVTGAIGGLAGAIIAWMCTAQVRAVGRLPCAGGRAGGAWARAPAWHRMGGCCMRQHALRVTTHMHAASTPLPLLCNRSQPQGLSGKITIDTLGGDYPMLAGNLVAICLSGIICVVLSLIKPQK